jgi:hypothetical protein
MVKEGTTEWLKRELTGHDQGDYADVMTEYRKAILKVDHGDVKKAYFRGAGVDAVVAELLKDYRAEQKRKDQEYNQGIDAANLNALKTQVMGRVKPTDDSARKHLDKVYEAFKGASVTDLGALPNGWGDYVTQRKAKGR